MTTLILTAALAVTLRAAYRLMRQRDAAAVENVRMMLRNDVLMDQLDAQIEETGQAREERQTIADGWVDDHRELTARILDLEAEALPKAPNWGAAPAALYSFDGRPLIFDGITTASAS